jgi:hypothetical protein
MADVMLQRIRHDPVIAAGFRIEGNGGLPLLHDIKAVGPYGAPAVTGTEGEGNADR